MIVNHYSHLLGSPIMNRNGNESVLTPRQERSQRTQEKLLEALESLLQERFFEQITIQDLADEAGVAVGTVYRRFRNVHRYLDVFGAEGDGENNLVILDYDAPTEVTAGNFLGHFVYGIDARHVESVIAQGRLIVEDGRVTTVDEAEVLAFAREMGRRLWEKL